MSYAVDMETKNRRQTNAPAAVTGAPSSSSIIVPAYKENANLRPLVTRLFQAFASHPQASSEFEEVEVIVVDDNSRDGSVETVEQLHQEGYNVRIIVRTAERGLSSAVVRGFREARGRRMICMDADLQVSSRYATAQYSRANVNSAHSTRQKQCLHYCWLSLSKSHSCLARDMARV